MRCGCMLVRAVLLPASMVLLGDWNWYLPKWLEWLPRLDVGDTVEKPKPPKAPPALEPTSSSVQEGDCDE